MEFSLTEITSECVILCNISIEPSHHLTACVGEVDTMLILVVDFQDILSYMSIQHVSHSFVCLFPENFIF